MQQSALDWRLRDLIDSKIIKSIPLTRESILSQVKGKIRMYMEGLSTLSSPQSTKRLIRSPLRKNSMAIGLPPLAHFTEQKDIVEQAGELKKLLSESM
jgi:hypothetical protein